MRKHANLHTNAANEMDLTPTYNVDLNKWETMVVI